MIDFRDRSRLTGLLRQLSPDQLPLFGHMTPQHMVEHLARIVRMSNGGEISPHYYSPEKEQRFKAFVLASDAPLVPGFRSPVLPPEGLPPLVHANLEEALSQLEAELTEFDRFFQENPTATPVNPSIGELTHEEWVLFHSKHFAHHLRQFGLLPG